MSLTLGEKLRQAREERGFTVSEVADQTRISPHYLECIENDDYRTLPGGIFNKGFVKSYAKFVGIGEQEALSDYSSLISRTQDSQEPQLKLYKPEVLTDDRARSSMVPTVITAVVILALMTAGILFLVNYLRRSAEPIAANTTATNPVPTSEQAENAKPANPSGVPEFSETKVEFTAMNQPVRLIATMDGTKSDNVIAAGASSTFEPKESLTLNYNRWNAGAVQLTINGKAISLPAEPLKGAADKGRIEFTISKENLAQIWTSGSITGEVPAVPPADGNTNTEAPATNTAVPPSNASVQPKPGPSAANTAANKPASNSASTAPKPSPEASKPAKTPAPAATPAKPAASPKPAANN